MKRRFTHKEKRNIVQLWDYLCAESSHLDSDAIVALGNHDCLGIALKAAELYHQKKAPAVVVCGGVKRLFHYQGGQYPMTEAEFMQMVLRDNGVPQKAIILENTSTNTGENFTEAKKLLNENGLASDSMTVVAIPYVTRRALLTAKKKIRGTTIRTVGTNDSLADYMNSPIRDKIVSQMMGTVQRIAEYPKKGLLPFSRIPLNVVKAFHELEECGFVSDMKNPRAKRISKHTTICKIKNTSVL